MARYRRWRVGAAGDVVLAAILGRWIDGGTEVGTQVVDSP